MPLKAATITLLIAVIALGLEGDTSIGREEDKGKKGYIIGGYYLYKEGLEGTTYGL